MVTASIGPPFQKCNGRSNSANTAVVDNRIVREKEIIMFRWKRLVSRLMLFALCCVFLQIAINPMLRWSIARSGNVVTGAAVDVDRVHVKWWKSELAIAGFRAADPIRPCHNLFDVEQVKLLIDPRSLARRHVVVKQAEVSGLNLDTARTSNEVITEENSKGYYVEWDERFSHKGIDWVESASQCLEAAPPLELESSQMAERLLSPWPSRLNQIEEEARRLNSRLNLISSELEASGQNPLRNADSFQKAIVDLGTIAKSMIDVRLEMDKVEQEIIDVQGQIEQVRLKEQPAALVQREVARLDEEELSEYLLGREVSARVTALVNWLRWGKQFLPALSRRTEALSTRGREVLFGEPVPRIVIENMLLRGARNVNGTPFQFEGRLCGLTSGYGENITPPNPTELTVQTTSGTPCLIEAVLNGDGRGAEDLIRVNCPSLHIPSRTLGLENQLALDVASGEAHLWVEMTTSGNALAGQLILKQPRTELVPRIDNTYRCSQVAAVLWRSVESIHELEMAVEIGGTLDHPSWSVRSNLGPQLARSLDQAMTDQLLVRDQESFRQAYAATDHRIANLKGELQAKRELISQLLSQGGQEIERVRDCIAGRVEQSDQLLENASPLRETLVR